MHYSKILIGNTSSGIIEAPSFGKYVVNVGNRQDGRARSKNILNVGFDRDEIAEAVKKGLSFERYEGSNIYYNQGAANKIIKIVKECL